MQSCSLDHLPLKNRLTPCILKIYFLLCMKTLIKMDCKSGSVLVTSNYRQGGDFCFSENGIFKILHDFFFPHVLMCFVFPTWVTDGVFLCKLVVFMDMLCLAKNAMLGKAIHHISLVFLWIPHLKQFAVEGNRGPWLCTGLVLFSLFSSLHGSPPHCCCGAFRREDHLGLFCLCFLLVSTLLTWEVMSWGTGELLAGAHWLVPGCWKLCQGVGKAVQSEGLAPQLQPSSA